MNTGFMGIGAIAPNRITHVVTGQMGVGAVIQEKKNTPDDRPSEIQPNINETDLKSLPFFSLKKIAKDKGYMGEMKKEPILEFLQSNS